MRFKFFGKLAPALAAVALCGQAPAQQPATMVQPALPATTIADTAHSSVSETSYTMKPFGQISVFRPDDQPKGVVLLLSGDGGWSPVETGMARALAQRGILVGGFSTTAMLKAMESGKGKCINPNYPLIDLAQDLQHRMGVRAYMKPIIFGWSSGATVAYAALAQWPNAGYRAVASLGFSSDLPGVKPWCKAPGFAYKAIKQPEKGWIFLPNSQIKVPWIVLQGQQDQVVSPAEARRFALTIPTARLIQLPRVGHGFAVQNNWMS